MSRYLLIILLLLAASASVPQLTSSNLFQ
jgi:thiol-disulfide isomerase/thioredoxin